MQAPSEPYYSFTIPSIHDDTTLDCRIYHPNVLEESIRFSDNYSKTQRWRTRGIVMAHPYAPMGGSYDDRVVSIVVDELLQAGYIVGTFNFRGAHGSKHRGRTSWSGRPELEDYTSFAACLVHYMSFIRPFPTPDTPFTPDQPLARPTGPQQSNSLPYQTPLVILGGYSYGSLILRHLPSIHAILQRFSAPLTGSAADEILLRARKLAEQSNLRWINLTQDHERERRRKGHEHKTSLIFGGEETSPDVRRSSRETKRSLDIPHSLDFGHRLRSLSHRSRRAGNSTSSLEQTDITLAIPEIRYLLISPLAPPISTVLAPALGQRLWGYSKGTGIESIEQLTALAVYGDQDIFASAKRSRDWCSHLKAEHPAFASAEINGAGHFWVEPGVEKHLRTVLGRWAVERLCEDAITNVAHESSGGTP